MGSEGLQLGETLDQLEILLEKVGKMSGPLSKEIEEAIRVILRRVDNLYTFDDRMQKKLIRLQETHQKLLEKALAEERAPIGEKRGDWIDILGEIPSRNLLLKQYTFLFESVPLYTEIPMEEFEQVNKQHGQDGYIPDSVSYLKIRFFQPHGLTVKAEYTNRGRNQRPRVRGYIALPFHQEERRTGHATV